MEKWQSYWRQATDPGEVERQLSRLVWLEDFAFQCGSEITPEHFRALQHQIQLGEDKLAKLRGSRRPEISDSTGEANGAEWNS